jgi:hypothetical protein
MFEIQAIALGRWLLRNDFEQELLVDAVRQVPRKVFADHQQHYRDSTQGQRASTRIQRLVPFGESILDELYKNN